MEASSKSARRRHDSREEDRNIEAPVHDEDDDHHLLYNAMYGEGGPKTAAYTDEERHQEEGDNETADDEQQEVEQETDNILDYAIEYRMRGSYPPGLMKDKKRAVRKRAQVISVEEGEVYIQRKKNKVCY